MLASQIPTKFDILFGQNAGSLIRTVPDTTADPNRASFNLGWPPNTATPVGAGGVPPDVRDFNGILNVITAWGQWLQAGGAPAIYDAAFQSAVGGYPKGAIVQSAVTPGIEYLSTAENNTTNPDASGAGWTSLNGALKANPGYIRFPNGFLIQGGEGSTITGSGDQINFPIAFPTACISVVADEAHASGTGWSPTQFSIYGTSPGPDPLTSFLIFCNVCGLLPGGGGTVNITPAGGFGFNWIAMGY